ncbi:nicotinate-nucleotide--dimethylbenzimidazole phosphoribosyltransferase [Streptomyces sp. AM 4-1-1]|uniref:nicotinate-nucleotide--dimethylbenzimidazole phosphoribosyltransferase n=1 Tax=Streptomyces sp. AM 4-1-1 TaxID=3028710 RepID=UPI0023B89462|nr:nicotinate-nucleotide--dimethylbenzimidazole phosphoribosyltransferase [Streptomyces sp. AM 4-1-1]WEH32543.1 nicotinate-nucleotide--dimethylbenzimidazole phosphoribosyltransferase [Streptomyces sp. AM 4-1-1]
MTDTGQVPGEGLPENAGMVEQPGVPAPDAYTFLDPSEHVTEDDDLLLMPSSQGGWGDPQVVPSQSVEQHHAGVPGQTRTQTRAHAAARNGYAQQQADARPGTHESGGRDSGAVDLSGVRIPGPAQSQSPAQPQVPVGAQAQSAARRPLHRGPAADAGPSYGGTQTGGVVRSLADRGPAGSPAARHSGPPTTGPGLADSAVGEAAVLPGPQLGEIPPQSGSPWAAQPPVPQAAPEPPVAAVTVPEPTVPEPASPEPASPEPASPEPPVAAVTVPEPTVPEPASPELAVPEPAVGEAPAAQVAESAPAGPAARPEPVVDAPSADAVAVETAPVAAETPATVVPAAAVAEATGVAEAEAVAEAPPAEAAEPSAAMPAEVPAEPSVVATDDGEAGEATEVADDAETADTAEVIETTGAVEAADGGEVASAEPAAPAAPVEGPAPVQVAEAADPEVAAEQPVTAEQVAPTPETAPEAAVEQPAVAGPVQTETAPAAEPVRTEPEVLQPEAPQPETAQPAAPAPEAVQPEAVAAEAARPDAVDPAAELPDAVTPEAMTESARPDAPVAEPGPARAAIVMEPAPVRAAPEAAPPEPVAVVEAAQPEPMAAEPVAPEATVTEPVAAEPVPPEAVAPEVTEPVTVARTAPGPEAPATSEAAAPESPEAAPAAERVPVPASVSVPAPEARPEAGTATENVEVPEITEPAAPAAAEAPAAVATDTTDEAVAVDEATEADRSAVESGTPAPETTAPAPGYDDAEREAVLRVMRERRDIRNGFRSDPIPHEVLLRVLEAAHTAPSVGHSQPWDFVVIRSAETRRSMHELAQRQRDAYAKSLPKGRAKQFKELKIEAILDTPVNIVVTADPTRGGRHTLGRHTQPQMAPYSSALAVENLWLAARAEGLGVGWVSYFDEREMVRALGLPEHLEVVAYLCVGYVDEFPEEPELIQAGWSKRRPLSWVVHEETYGRRALPGEEPHDLLQETIANIRPLDAKALGEAWERQKRMTKPAGALGMLEIISAQLSGLSRMCPPPIPEPAAVAIFAGDHGVHAQGVTAWPQEVTAQMVANFLGGGAVCNAFAAQVGAEVCVVDVGVASDLPATPGLLPRKVRPGTADFTVGPALTREEVLAAVEVGIETARDLVAAGNKGLLTGEMGIANTTASAALICVYTGIDPAEVTGRGTGINDEMHARKVDVVRRGLELHRPDPADPIGVLAAVGGLEHAAMAGFVLGGASLRTPVILDGVSAGAAALVAHAIAPEALAACIAGHRSAEPGHVAALNKLGLRPLVDLDLRLGEGTGALLALPVVQSAARAMHEVATFDSAGVTEK